MAIYHFSASVGKRSAGRSATAAAAYRAAVRIHDERTGETHDYTRRSGVLDHAILTPEGLPNWTRNSARLWNAVEQFEKRKDAQLFLETNFALPCELTLEQNRALLHGYVQEAYVAHGRAAQADIHGPDKRGDQRNMHAHVMVSMREITGEGFNPKKPREWGDRKALLIQSRELWAEHVNRALERAGRTERVDARSFAERGIQDRAPASHLGPAATEMERRGEQSRIGDENRTVRSFNEAVAQRKVIDLEIEREKRRQQETAQAERARKLEAIRKRQEARQAARDRQAEFIRDRRAQEQQAARAIWDREAYERERATKDIDAAVAQAKERERAKGEQRAVGRQESPAAPAMPRQRRQGLWREFNEARQLSPEQFDEFRNRKRAALQSTQIEEMQTRKTQAERAVEQAGETARASRPELQNDRQTLSWIAERQQRGGLYWLIYHLSGKARDDRGQIEPLQNNIRSAEERIEEDIGRVRAREEADIAALGMRHQAQRRELENNLEQARRRNPHVQQQEREREERRQATADEIRRNMERQRHRDRSRGMER